MAVNCSQNLLNDLYTRTFLIPNQVYSGTILNQNDADYYEYEMFENETMTYKIRVFPQTLQAINMKLKLYRYSNGILTELGTSFITQFYNEFDYDGNPGEYRFCLTTDFPVDYEIEVGFTDYPYTALPDFDAYHGGNMPPFEFAKKASTCDSPVFYQIINGELPPGLEMNASGYISGVLGELDCITPSNLKPSFTFFDESPELGELARISTSYDFHITVRAALVDATATYADRDFLICIRNNWDYDRDAYMAGHTEFERKKYTEIKIKGEPLPDPTKDDVQELCPCPVEDNTTPELTPLQLEELCAVCAIEPEFSELLTINNGICEVCEEPEPEGVIVLSEIEQSDVCVPCEEPEVVEGLQPISPSLCPCTVETVEIEATRILYEDIPDDCSPDLIDAMFAERVCDGHPMCGVRLPIYPEPVDDNGIILPNQCETECNI